MFKLGYNTNGYASHSLLSAMDIIGDQGYQSIAITIDHHALNPFAPDLNQQIRQVRRMLTKHRLSSVIETGARFLLNPYVKHEPTLISPEKEQREYRIRFIEKCIDIAAELGSDCVSIWSGKKQESIGSSQAWEWLVYGCTRISRKAGESCIMIGFEPEPGMFVENMNHYDRLKQKVNHDAFKLTLDLGHALITENDPIPVLHAYRNDVINIHLEDMKKDRHNHLFFGEGDMAFGNVFQALREIRYQGQVNIELSRHSHNAVDVSRNALEFIKSMGCDSGN